MKRVECAEEAADEGCEEKLVAMVEVTVVVVEAIIMVLAVSVLVDWNVL